jgi:hypothetical protein
MKAQYEKMVQTRRRNGSYDIKVNPKETKERRRLWQVKYRKTSKGKAIYERYATSDIGRNKAKIRARDLRKTDKYKEWRKKYEKADKRKIVNMKYSHGEKFKIQQRKYLESPKGRLYAIKRQCRRRENMKFIQLMDNPFPKEISIDWHHTNNSFVVPMPRDTHNSVGGSRTIHREKCKNILNNWNMSIPIKDGSACN